MNEEYRRKTDDEIEKLTKAVEEIKHTHLVDNAEIAKFQSTMTYVLYGNKENNEIGMKDKVDEIHALLVQAKAVGGFFGGIKSLAGWLLVIGALVALFKGWLAGLLAWVLIK